MNEIKEGDIVFLISQPGLVFTVGRIEENAGQKVAVCFYVDVITREIKKSNVPLIALGK